MTQPAPCASSATRIRTLEPGPRAADQVASWMGLPAAALVETFPQIYGMASPGTRLGIVESEITRAPNDLIAHAAAHDVVWNGARLRLIGSVATHPDHRGRGLASRLLEALIGDARTQGLDALVLWSDQPEFYARLGFAPVGAQHRGLARAATRLDPRVRLATAGDLPAILGLHQQKPTRIERDLSTLAQQLSAHPMSTYVLAEGSTLLAYACCGKGADFGGWWHEFGGADTEVKVLVETATALQTKAAAPVLLPSWRTALRGAWQDAGQEPAALAHRLRAADLTGLFVDGLDSV